MVRVGVFGGAFDPVHTGHLAVAQDAVAALDLDRVLFVPTARPPHRKEGPFASAHGRVEMVRAALADNEAFEVWTGEFEREGPSYTVDTLHTLKERHPQTSFFLIVGADQFARFATWKEPKQIAALAEIVVVGRDGDDGTSADNEIPYRNVTVPRLEVSSSDIRNRVREGRPIRYLVPDSVARIIEEHGWYKNG